MRRIAVVGAGIVGLATAARLAERGEQVLVIDKETRLAVHQTGRNSGVVHSGLYYQPGSSKAIMAAAGVESMRRFALDRGVPYERCGKLVVAVTDRELAGLHTLHDRARANGVPVRLVSPAEAREHEPYVRCVEAMWVESTGIIDFTSVCRALADDVVRAGGEVRLGEAVHRAVPDGAGLRLLTSAGEHHVDGLIACAGLYADHVARACGVDPTATIVPFRGEYYELAPNLRHLVRGLVYPVPDPRFPFLGVHLTRMIHGGIHAGPNAVLALRREGYSWGEVDVRELAETLRWPGLWRLARRNVAPGAAEMVRSLSTAAFARALSRMVPGIDAASLVPTPAGVRAQALTRRGDLVDDFLVRIAPGQVHVINAPSPAATASLEIARHLVSSLDEALG